MCGDPATVTVKFRLRWWARLLLRAAVFSAPCARLLPRWLRVRLVEAIAWTVGKGVQVIP